MVVAGCYKERVIVLQQDLVYRIQNTACHLLLKLFHIVHKRFFYLKIVDFYDHKEDNQ
jgi:hypothetical protein